MAFLALLAIFLVLQVVSYLLMPKPKVPKPEAAKDMDNPTAEAGREIPVVFGTVTIKGLNILDYGDKSISTFQMDA